MKPPRPVVVGAGVAGLTAALCLARAGLRPRLLEQNHQVGGLAAGIRRRGVDFEVGCQSVLDGGVLFPLLDHLGMLDDRWDRVAFRLRSEQPGLDFVAHGLEQVRTAFCDAEPEAAAGLSRVFDDHAVTSRWLDALASGPMPLLVKGRMAAALATSARQLPGLPRLWRRLREPFEGFYRRHLGDTRTGGLLGSLGYPGMSALIAGAFWHFWCHDYWYPRGGLGAFCHDLAAAVESQGGEVHTRAPVRRVCLHDGKPRAVELEDGNVVPADQVVLAIDLPQALGRLLPESTRWRRLRGRPLSQALVAAYVQVEQPYDEVRAHLGADHLFHLPAGRTSFPELGERGHRSCWIQIAVHRGAASCAGRCGVVVQAFTDATWQDNYGLGQGPALPRTRRYRELKAAIGDDLVANFIDAAPGLGPSVGHVEVGTPYSTLRFTRAPQGASAGYTYFFPRVSRHAWSRRGPYRGVYLCGNTTLWPGSVATAMLSGQMASSLLLGDLGSAGHQILA